MLYEFTVTLVPHYCRQRSGRDQHVHASAELLSLFAEYLQKDPSFRVSVIAELHKSNDVHYHGLLELKDHIARDRFINRLRLRKIFGRRSISQLIHYSTWCEYMNKDTKITRDIIGDPIVIDDFNVYSDVQYRFIPTSDQPGT